MIEFDGSEDYLSVADNADLDFAGTAAFTLEAWIRPDALDVEDNILDKSADDDSSVNYRFLTRGGGKLTLFGGTAAPTNIVETAAGAITTGAWQHVAAVYDNGSVTLYVNGTAQLTFQDDGSA